MHCLLNDEQIKNLCTATAYSATPMLAPFEPQQKGKPSYGLGSFGYDIRLGNKFLVPIGGINKVLDPVDFPLDHFQQIHAEKTLDMVPGSQVLAESIEMFDIPNDIAAICWGKSSYARCGLLVNVTPLEPGWRGILTLQLVNLSPLPIRLHIYQGIAQVVFFRGITPQRTYTEKEAGGLYQNQTGPTLPQ